MNKPEAADAAFFALPDRRIVALTGRDAVAFAQAQTMNDVAALGDGDWQWSGWLTPKGRVIALFALLRLDADTLWLLLADADRDAAERLAAGLRRFVFRSKVAIAARDDLRVGGAFNAPSRALGANIDRRDGDGGFDLDLGADGGARTLRIAAGAFADDADARARWNAFDLAHGLPQLPASQRELWTPQQLALERLRAYSVKKGCYPGQEIVARTHFLGQAKRGLARLRGDTVPEPGAEVSVGERAIGSIVAATAVAGGGEGLAVAALDHGDGPVRIGAAAAAFVPLAGGLAR
jgi:folate-binding protein YgfZ